ncbi:phage tail tube protein [Sphingomonas sp. CARO-RG-8B-R24-01]|uniref:phage tail tube protein n=1 Tax=Sphingomonas sp. CARO-RG-8B-R24-01 TaxID=2914831 RepID=UPI001F5A8DE2|nr:phage tail tube protein [Sphingomonas sp. CARO-RG-8B-R24-01]
MVTTPNLLAGTCYLTLDGKSVSLVGEFAYRPTQTTNETLKGMDGIHGFKSSPEAGMIKGKLRDTGAISIQDLGNAVNITVVAVLANGKTIVGRNMWRVGEPLEADADDATVSVQWESADVRES